MPSYTVRRGVRRGQNKAHAVVAGITLIYIIGLVFGSAYANFINKDAALKLSLYLSSFFNGSNTYIGTSGDLFLESILKYGKFMMAFWVLSFVSPGLIISLLLMLFKGASTGFAASFFIKDYGFEGAYNIILLLLLQNLAIVPAYIYTLYSGFCFAAKTIAPQIQRRRKSPISAVFSNLRGIGISEYIVVLAIGAACVTLASLIEVYILPGIVSFL